MANSSQAKRQIWIDWAKGLAVIVMVHCHLTTLLGQNLPGEARLHDLLGFLHGLVAPCFIFCAGYGLALGMWKRLQCGGKLENFWKKIRWWAWIFLLGYLMHLPIGNTLVEWRRFEQMDVLSLISTGAILMICLEFLFIKLPARRFWIMGIWGVIVILAVGLVAQMREIHVDFRLIESIWNSEENELFPIFPWMGFFGVGVLCAFFSEKTWRLFAILGGILAFCSPFVDWSNLSIGFFAVRVGWVLLAIGILREFALRGFVNERLRNWGNWLGQNSLVLYLAHLGLLYIVLENLIQVPIKSWFAFESLYVVVLLVSFGITLAFNYLKIRIKPKN